MLYQGYNFKPKFNLNLKKKKYTKLGFKVGNSFEQKPEFIYAGARKQ